VRLAVDTDKRNLPLVIGRIFQQRINESRQPWVWHI
jgi:hypothetical protein